ncbi:MAG: pitrilysin family protein [Desulfuromonadales bacterium]|nr:pitrilysin family protein [Desulfuromonadales bacterium]
MIYLIRLLVLPFFLLCLAGLPARSQQLADKVREHRLDNGLTLLMVERHLSPTVAAYITFRVGGVHESSRQRGAAHLLEHMLFKGTRTLGTKDYEKEKPLLEEIERVGSAIDRLKIEPDADSVRLDELRQRLQVLQQEHREWVVKDEFSRIYAEHGGVGFNAFTSKDLTSYVISLPANKLELWASIESDRLQNAVLREFYTEREVVREERRRSYESNPGGLLYETLLATAYRMHPYRNPVIGWDSDIDNLTLAETSQFLHDYYAPANMVITLVGAFDPDETLDLIRRYFGHIEPGTPVPTVADREPEQRGERRAHIVFDAEPRMAIAFHKPTMPHHDDYVFDLLMQTLAAGRTSRLYRALVVEQQVATSVDVYTAPGSRYDNLMVIAATPRHPHTAAEVESAIYAELERLMEEPVAEDELETARNRILTDFLRRLNSNEGMARMLSSYQALGGDWRYLVEYEKQVAALTSEDLQEVARRYLHPGNRTVITLGRNGGES